LRQVSPYQIFGHQKICSELVRLLFLSVVSREPIASGVNLSIIGVAVKRILLIHEKLIFFLPDPVMEQVMTNLMRDGKSLPIKMVARIYRNYCLSIPNYE